MRWCITDAKAHTDFSYMLSQANCSSIIFSFGWHKKPYTSLFAIRITLKICPTIRNIAIVFVDKPFVYNERVTLPSPNVVLESEWKALMSGWGSLRP